MIDHLCGVRYSERRPASWRHSRPAATISG
jgi:hypothetical protein